MLAVSTCSEGQNRRKMVLSWLVVDVIFVLHHVLLHIFTIIAIVGQANGRELAPLMAFINMLILIPYAISMLVAVGFFPPILMYYNRIKNKTDIQNRKNGENIEILVIPA